jgi:hypothetical protein
VADLGRVLDLAAAALVPAGVLVVVEWARERFDEAAAGWCFARLPSPGEDRGWLNDRYEQWQASGQPWDVYFRSWADGEGIVPRVATVTGAGTRFRARRTGAGRRSAAGTPRSRRR